MTPLPQNFFNSLPIIVISFIILSILLSCPGYFIWRKMDMNLKKILLIVVSSITVNQYLLVLLGLSFQSPSVHIFGILGLTVLWCTILAFVLLNNETQNNSPSNPPKSNKKLFLIILALITIVIIISTAPRIDLLINRSSSPNASIAVSSVHDDIKHIAILNSIKNNGILTTNPFFGEEYLKYYTAYYILPAAISKTFNFPTFPVWFFWTLLTNIIWILSMFLILTNITKNYVISFLIATFSLIMGGWDIIPTVYYQTFSYIEVWNDNIGRNIQIPTPYTYFIFLSQHIFAATIYILLSFHFFFKKTKKSPLAYLIIGIIISLITGNSAYIGLFCLITLSIFVMLENETLITKIRNITLIGLGLSITILPFLKLILGNNAGFNLSYPTLTALSSNPLIQTLLSFTWALLLDFGWLIVAGICGILYFFKKNKANRPQFITLQIVTFFISLILVHFVSTKFYNDCGMKGSLFMTISLTFLAAYIIGNKIKRLYAFISLMLIGSATFVLTIFQLYKPYIYIENGARELLEYAEENTPKDAVILGDTSFYNSLIPIIANRATIVSPQSPEANTVAQQNLFLENNKRLQVLFSTSSADELDQILSALNKNYVFITKASSINAELLKNNVQLENTYSNYQYSLFSYKQ